MGAWTLLLSATLVVAQVSAINGACENFRLPSYYGSSMVLHRAPAQAGIWGYTDNIGDEVKLTIADQVITTNAIQGPENIAIWRVTLDPIEAGGPYTITVTFGECEVELTDVLFGDVWLCSGQSNMVHRLDRLDDPEADIADVVNYPDVRSYRSRQVFSTEPLYDIINPAQTWARPTPSATQAFSAICWLFGRNLHRKLNIPIGLVQSTWGGTRIEAWSPPEVFDECFPGGTGDRTNQNQKSVLYNAMIHPLLPMTITGAIWYQGEANQGNAADYGCALGSMVKHWRNNFFQNTDGQTDILFPFGQVQLAAFRNNDKEDGFPDVRWHQTAAYGFTPNADLERIFTAVAMDLPDYDSPFGSIHPRYKRPIADRLTLGALNVGYGMESAGSYQGPFPTDHHLHHHALEIIFDNDESDLDHRSEDGFEICCSSDPDVYCPAGDAMWLPAPIVEQYVSSVIINVTCTIDKFVTGVRYAWRESPCPMEACAVYSKDNNLPAPSYLINQYLPNEGSRL